VVDQLTKTEASAMSAYNQLMAEEEEAAAKAAAKKAKKQKQKAKKQQAQQAESSADAQALAASETQSLPSDSAPELKLESSERLHKRNVPALDDVGREPHASDVVTPPQSPNMRPLHVTTALTPHSANDRKSGGDQVAPSVPATGVISPPHPGHNRQGGGDQMVPGRGPGDDEKFLQNLLCCPITRVCTTPAACDVASCRLHLLTYAADCFEEPAPYMHIDEHSALSGIYADHCYIYRIYSYCRNVLSCDPSHLILSHTSTHIALASLEAMQCLPSFILAYAYA